ncbi:rod shape-determining protein MreD [Candidatus Kuenenbacteria bacterium]|nr:rod shape-determining protein MreD [Candidatus Kuenenbacteria bacterium]
MIKFIKHFLLLFSLLIAQIAVVPALPGNFKNLNVILISLVFICIVYRFYLGVSYALILGFVLELYSALPFGAMILSLMLTLYVIYKIFQHLLTNKSFYTLAGLSILATVIYNGFIYVYLVALYFNQTKDLQLIKQLSVLSGVNILWQLLFNIIFVTILFIFFHVSSTRFKAVFVDTVKR